MDFSTVHNYHENTIFRHVQEGATRFPAMARQPELLADVACVALNRVAPRYVRHDVDLAFYLTEKERAAIERNVGEAVEFAFGFVQARHAMRARS